MINTEKLIAASSLLVSTLETSEILPRAMEIIKGLLGCDAASIMLLDPETQNLIFEVALGEKSKALEKVTIPRGKGIAGEVALSGEAKIINDVQNYPGFDPSFDKNTGFETKGILCVPLKLKNSVLGIAQAINPTDKKHFDEEDLFSLTLFANQVALALEASRMHKNILLQKSLEKELSLARTIQESFLPKVFPANPAFEVFAKTLPARQVGGDFYSVFDLGNNRFGFAIGDVSGKGVAAAIFMARILSDLEVTARDEKNLASPAAVITALNHTLFTRKNTNMFVTLLFAVLDTNLKKISLASAGHPYPYLLKPDNNWQEIKTLNGLPAGIAKDARYGDLTVKVEKDDLFFCFTDALSEMPGKEKKSFIPTALACIQNHSGNLEESGEDVFTALKSFSPAAYDDATLLLLKIK